jgi:hypothetical protein
MQRGPADDQSPTGNITQSRGTREQIESGPYGQVPSIDCEDYQEFKDGGGLAVISIPFCRAGITLRISDIKVKNPAEDLRYAYILLPPEVKVREADENAYFTKVVLRAIYRYHIGDSRGEDLGRHDSPLQPQLDLISYRASKPPISCDLYRRFEGRHDGLANLSMSFDGSSLELLLDNVYIRDSSRSRGWEVYLPDRIAVEGELGRQTLNSAVMTEVNCFCREHGMHV